MTDGVILAIDTATAQGGVALWQGDRLLIQSQLSVPREHSKRLFVEIESALVTTGTDRSNLTAVAVTIGPGSFTGLRIGLSAAKGLCRALQIPLVTISTLEAMAARVLWAPHPVVCLLDARRGEVYAGVYDTSQGVPVCLEPPGATTVSDILARWEGRPLLLIGDGVHVFSKELCDVPEAIPVPSYLHAPDAAAVAWLARGRVEAGEFANIELVEPEYLRHPTFATIAEQAAGVC